MNGRFALVSAVVLILGSAPWQVLAEDMEPLSMIDDLWNFGDPPASEARFRALILRADSEPAYRAEAMTQLARAVGLQRRFDEARSILSDVESLTDDVPSRVRVRLDLERGRVENSSGNPAASVEHFERALLDADRLDEEFLAIDAAHMLGIVSSAQDSIRWNTKAIGMAEAAADPRARRWLGSLYNNLGWTYFDMGRFDDALPLFEADVEFRESTGQLYEASIARWSRAKIIRVLGRPAEALDIQMRLLDDATRQDDLSRGYTHEEIAECLLALNRADEAAVHFAAAHELLGADPWLVANDAERLARILSLSAGAAGAD